MSEIAIECQPPREVPGKYFIRVGEKLVGLTEDKVVADKITAADDMLEALLDAQAELKGAGLVCESVERAINKAGGLR